MTRLTTKDDTKLGDWERQELLSLYSNCTEEIRFYKRQQSLATHYALLANAAVVAARSLLPRYPLSEVPAALRRFGEASHKGKIVINMPESPRGSV